MSKKTIFHMLAAIAIFLAIAGVFSSVAFVYFPEFTVIQSPISSLALSKWSSDPIGLRASIKKRAVRLKKKEEEIYLEGLNSGSSWVRYNCAYTLAEMNKNNVNVLLAQSIFDEDAEVKAVAMVAYSKSGDMKYIDAIEKNLRDSSVESYVRWHAAMALGHMVRESSRKALIDCINDPDPLVRWNVITSLGSLLDIEQIDLFSAAAKDNNPSIKEAAEVAISRIKLRDANHHKP